MELTPAVLRSFIRDTSSLNKVFAGVEFQDSDYAAAILWGDEKQASIPPFMEGFSASDLPVDLRRIGALASLFEMAYLLEIRNMSNLSEQGVPVPVGENALVYERLHTKYEGMFEKKVNDFKVVWNMQAAIRRQYGIYEQYKARAEGNY